MKREATAIWLGGLKDGRGTIATESNALSGAPYAFSTRFEDNLHGTNPEELIAGAHAACFSMALAHELETERIMPEEVRTSARVSIEREGGGWKVTRSELETVVKAAVRVEKFREIAEKAKANCPISKLLKAEITLEASLEPPDAERSVAQGI